MKHLSFVENTKHCLSQKLEENEKKIANISQSTNNDEKRNRERKTMMKI